MDWNQNNQNQGYGQNGYGQNGYGQGYYGQSGYQAGSQIPNGNYSFSGEPDGKKKTAKKAET